MSNLFELLISYKQLYNKLDEGYSIEDLQDTLDSIEADMKTKVDNTVGLIRRVEAHTYAIYKEIKRLKAMKQQQNNFISSLKQQFFIVL